jgi:hypothetical protein
VPRAPKVPPGKDAQRRVSKQPKVTCQVTNRSKGVTRAKATCVVKLPSSRQQMVRWRLVRHGRTYGQGVVFARNGQATLRIPGVDRLRRGRYVLRIVGKARGTQLVIG